MFDSMFYTTLLYYSTIALASVVAVSFAVKKKMNLQRYETSIRMPLYVLSAIILLIPLVITTTGIDRPVYIAIFQNITIDDVLDFGQQEPLFMFINYLLRLFGESPYILFTFFYGLMIFNIYYVIYQYREKISIPFAVFIFAMLFYIQSINLMRIYVAGSILLVASYFLCKKNNFKCLLLTILASLIHYASFLFLLAILAYEFYAILKDKFAMKTVIMFILLTFMFVTFIFFIPVIKNLPIIERYSSYLELISFNNIGMYQISIYLPIIIIIVLYTNDCNVGKSNVAVANLFACFFCAMMGYFIPIIGRSFVLFMFPFVIWLPMLIKQFQSEIFERRGEMSFKILDEKHIHYIKDKRGEMSFKILDEKHIHYIKDKRGEKAFRILYNKRLQYILVTIFIVCYVLFRYFLYLSQYIDLDKIGIVFM